MDLENFGILDETKHTHKNFNILHFIILNTWYFVFYGELNTPLVEKFRYVHYKQSICRGNTGPAILSICKCHLFSIRNSMIQSGFKIVPKRILSWMNM
jgi:hypothetical protein